MRINSSTSLSQDIPYYADLASDYATLPLELAPNNEQSQIVDDSFTANPASDHTTLPLELACDNDLAEAVYDFFMQEFQGDLTTSSTDLMDDNENNLCLLEYIDCDNEFLNQSVIEPSTCSENTSTVAKVTREEKLKILKTCMAKSKKRCKTKVYPYSLIRKKTYSPAFRANVINSVYLLRSIEQVAKQHNLPIIRLQGFVNNEIKVLNNLNHKNIRIGCDDEFLNQASIEPSTHSESARAVAPTTGEEKLKILEIYMANFKKRRKVKSDPYSLISKKTCLSGFRKKVLDDVYSSLDIKKIAQKHKISTTKAKDFINYEIKILKKLNCKNIH